MDNNEIEKGYIYIRNNDSYSLYCACKLGKTTNIPDRETLYVTCEIKRGIFSLVVEVLKSELDDIELLLKNHFSKNNIYNDAGTEFYHMSIFNKIVPFLNSQNIYNRQLSKTEITELLRTCRNKSTIHIKKPYEYQQQIIDKSIEYFKTNDKGLLVLVCGVGKTLISSWITQLMDSKKILIGVGIALAIASVITISWLISRRKNKGGGAKSLFKVNRP